MEPSENSEAIDFSLSIDIIASDYCWTLDQILDLTADQLSLFLKAGQKRRKDEMLTQLGMMRLAYASTQSKEGNEAYQNFLNDMREQKVMPVKDLSKVGLSIHKG